MVKIKVPELMNAKGWNASNLMRKAKVAYKTAHRLSKGKADSISFEILNSLCEIFAAKVQDALEYIPDRKK
jgi:DNA-binding Xre family transcriptional regulator